jgi:hypothetical protein
MHMSRCWGLHLGGCSSSSTARQHWSSANWRGLSTALPALEHGCAWQTLRTCTLRWRHDSNTHVIELCYCIVSSWLRCQHAMMRQPLCICDMLIQLGCSLCTTSRQCSVLRLTLQVLPVVCQWIAELQASLLHGGNTAVQIAGANVAAAPSCGFFATCSSTPLSSTANSFRSVCITSSDESAEGLADQRPPTKQTQAKPSDAAAESLSMQHAEASICKTPPSEDPAAIAALTERLLGHFGGQGPCDGVLQLAKPLAIASAELCAFALQGAPASNGGGNDPGSHDAERLLKVGARHQLPPSRPCLINANS